jgi:hypothetical protein
LIASTATVEPNCFVKAMSSMFDSAVIASLICDQNYWANFLSFFSVNSARLVPIQKS